MASKPIQLIIQWRDDPEKTRSDWKIEIVAVENYSSTDEDDRPTKKQKTVGLIGIDDETETEDNGNIEIYNVHQCVVGYGFRKSGYFASLLEEPKRYAEGGRRTSRIELHPLAAKAFPQVLDFMYSVSDPKISTENATALHRLGDYFDIPQLVSVASNFWKRDMSLENVQIYYEHAKIFIDDKVLEAVQALCSDPSNVMRIPSSVTQIYDSELWLAVLGKIPANYTEYRPIYSLIIQYCEKGDVDAEAFSKLMAGVLEKSPEDAIFQVSSVIAKQYETEDTSIETLQHILEKVPKSDKNSLHMSSLVAKCCENKEIEAKTFHNLTRADILPNISLDAAPKLSDLEDHMKIDGAADHNGGLSSLQERCVETMSRDWDKFSLSKQFLKRKQVPFLAELYTKTLSMAQDDKNGLQQSITQEKADRELLRKQFLSMKCFAKKKINDTLSYYKPRHKPLKAELEKDFNGIRGMLKYLSKELKRGFPVPAKGEE